ncbi:hypothetical protein RvY_16531 [Ramazzottius varieornatus]|uniref:Uncharacterized protein n=1 Tax=Ramazzottius varieornatus TaxID=947166 RepID=A0A1D1VYT0_RAMVA|nr:hypothetical protein RvY_16531 [Ramazzottius varieornatus]
MHQHLPEHLRPWDVVFAESRARSATTLTVSAQRRPVREPASAGPDSRGSLQAASPVQQVLSQRVTGLSALPVVLGRHQTVAEPRAFRLARSHRLNHLQYFWHEGLRRLR